MAVESLQLSDTEFFEEELGPVVESLRQPDQDTL